MYLCSHRVSWCLWLRANKTEIIATLWATWPGKDFTVVTVIMTVVKSGSKSADYEGLYCCYYYYDSGEEWLEVSRLWLGSSSSQLLGWGGKFPAAIGDLCRMLIMCLLSSVDREFEFCEFAKYFLNKNKCKCRNKLNTVGFIRLKSKSALYWLSVTGKNFDEF